MDVVAKRLEVMRVRIGAVDRNRLVAPLENISAPVSRAVPTLAECRESLFHSADEIGLWGFKQNMEVISHEHPGVNPPAVAGADLSEAEDKRLAVVVGDKHGIAAVAAGHHVVDCSRIFESRLPGHAQDCASLSERTRFL